MEEARKEGRHGRQAGRQQDQLEARQQASRQRRLCCVRHRSGLIMGDKKKEWFCAILYVSGSHGTDWLVVW